MLKLFIKSWLIKTQYLLSVDLTDTAKESF